METYRHIETFQSFRLEKTFRLQELASHKGLKHSLHTKIQPLKYVVTPGKCNRVL